MWFFFKYEQLKRFIRQVEYLRKADVLYQIFALELFSLSEKKFRRLKCPIGTPTQTKKTPGNIVHANFSNISKSKRVIISQNFFFARARYLVWLCD